MKVGSAPRNFWQFETAPHVRLRKKRGNACSRRLARPALLLNFCEKNISWQKVQLHKRTDATNARCLQKDCKLEIYRFFLQDLDTFQQAKEIDVSKGFIKNLNVSVALFVLPGRHWQTLRTMPHCKGRERVQGLHHECQDALAPRK